MAPSEDLDLREQVARIDRNQAEIQKLFEETFKLTAERGKLLEESFKLTAERGKLLEESFKLAAETRKLGREALIAPFTAGAAVTGAVVAAMLAVQKLLG